MSISHFQKTVPIYVPVIGYLLKQPVFDVEEAASSEVRILFTLADIDEL